MRGTLDIAAYSTILQTIREIDINVQWQSLHTLFTALELRGFADIAKQLRQKMWGNGTVNESAFIANAMRILYDAEFTSA